MNKASVLSEMRMGARLVCTSGGGVVYRLIGREGRGARLQERTVEALVREGKIRKGETVKAGVLLYRTEYHLMDDQP